MKLGLSIVAPILVIAAITFFIGTHYIVISYNPTTTLRKRDFSITPIVLDIRTWDIMDLIYNPSITTLFVEQGKTNLLPGGETTIALIKQGEAGLEIMEELLEAGVSSLEELDAKYDVSGQAKMVLKDASKLAKEIDNKYDISGKTKDAADKLKKWIKN